MAIEQTLELERALQLAADRRASDIYFLPQEPLCLRVHGELVRMDGPPLIAADIREMAAAAVGEERLAEIGRERGRIVTSCGIAGGAAGRMTIARSRGDYTVVVRVLPRHLPTVEEARVPDAVLRASESPLGLILFSGLAGSGKTTTMLAVLERLNQTRAVHICTVEDPIAYILSPKRALVQQREVGVDVPDVASGLLAAMGQDPDVLMVGEIRTAEEAQACVTAANTGHLVLTQVHAPTPEAAVERLVEVQPPEHTRLFRRDLSQAMRAAVAQILLPRPGGDGREPAYGVLLPDDAMRRTIAEGGKLLERGHPLPAGCQMLAEQIQALRREGRVEAAAADAALDRLQQGCNVPQPTPTDAA